LKVNVIFYSAFGHIYRMAQAVAEGAGEVDGAEVGLYQVRETLPDEILDEMGALEPRKQFADVPVATLDQLREADALIFGTPTRFGNMCQQMKALIDSAGPLWVSNALVGKVAGVFTSSNSQHGGQESTILSFHIPLYHFGMVIVGLPYTESRIRETDRMQGGSPYGASTIAGENGSRRPSGDELEMARSQGRHVAEIARKLTAG